MNGIADERLLAAGPISLAAAMTGMAVSAALSMVAPWAVFVIAAMVPSMLTIWLVPTRSLPIRLTLCSAAILAGAAVAAGFVLLTMPLFRIVGIGLSGAGVYLMLYGPVAAVSVASLAIRVRSGMRILTPWIAWWSLVAVGLIWGEGLTYRLTDLAGADAMAGTVAFLIAPTIGMAAWAGVVSVRWIWSRNGQRRQHQRWPSDR